MNYDHKKDRRLVTGSGGSGKTTHFISLFCAKRARWKFVFDPEREISRKLKLPICIDVPGMERRCAQGIPVCFDPDPLFRNHEEGLDFFCTWVWSVASSLQGVKLFACDEIQDFTANGRGGIPDSFKRIMQKGRRQEIDVLLIAQSLGEAHDKIRAQLSHVITFRHTDTTPLDWLQDSGFDREAVKQLTYPGGWICRNKDTGEQTTNEKAKTQQKREASDPAPRQRGHAIEDRGRFGDITPRR